MRCHSPPGPYPKNRRHLPDHSRLCRAGHSGWDNDGLPASTDTPPSPRALPAPALLHPAWVEFNAKQWGLTPLPVDYVPAGKPRPRLSGLLYLDRRGRVVQPRLNQELPFVFDAGPPKPGEAARDWRSVAPLLAAELVHRGILGSFSLPVEFTDMRPFAWAGLRVGVRYTTCVDLPYDIALAEPDIRRRANKAAREGFAATVHGSIPDLLACLRATESRKSITLGIDEVALPALEALASGMGREAFRVYVTHAPDGRAASSCVVLCEPGGRALLWVAGNAREFLPTGAVQLNFATALADCAAAGARYFDFNGAGIASVAASKEAWGGRLVPQYTLETPGLRNLVRDAWHLLRRTRRVA
jgi:hypothetical protein